MIEELHCTDFKRVMFWLELHLQLPGPLMCITWPFYNLGKQAPSFPGTKRLVAQQFIKASRMPIPPPLPFRNCLWPRKTPITSEEFIGALKFISLEKPQSRMAACCPIIKLFRKRWPRRFMTAYNSLRGACPIALLASGFPRHHDVPLYRGAPENCCAPLGLPCLVSGRNEQPRYHVITL